ncbi:MAG: hypothetical protein IPG10_11020 [Flavobacteriales bacterium]|jgi:hypothetical protein|nr:hypothetical protein [Flavobacteriales bacterium]
MELIQHPASSILEPASVRAFSRVLLTSMALLFSVLAPYAQSVVLDNTGTTCAYTVAIKWGSIGQCTTPPSYPCPISSSSSHHVNGGQLLTVPVPAGADGPCQLKVLNGSNVQVADGRCHIPNGGFDFNDCNINSVHIDVTQAWTVKWLYN